MTRMLSAALAAFLLAAAPAAASGGGTTPPPAPEPTTDPCEPYWALPEIVNRTAGGCVVVGQTASGTLFLDFVALNPGWSYTVENGGGTKSRVQLSFSGPDGAKASIRVEPGKTDIR